MTNTLLSTAGREALSFKHRVTASLAAIALLHLIGLGLLSTNWLLSGGGAVTVGMAVFAYARGLIHSYDFDHVSMIDNSTRKFIAEGRRPASVGLAFSAGHSTVVIITGILVVAGAGTVRTALDENSGLAKTLGLIGLSVSGLYLFLVAIANVASFVAAWRLRRRLQTEPDLEVSPADLSPRGPAARIMTAPLSRVRHPRHIYLIGFLFSLGFDTSSQIGLLMLTGSAAIAGVAPIALLALPFLFAAAMTLGDTVNGLMMLKMYESASNHPSRRVNFNLAITGISIVSALLVGVLALASILTETVGLKSGVVGAVAALPTDYAGFLLAGLFAVVGLVAVIRWRVLRTR